jgi:hypothetical protein
MGAFSTRPWKNNSQDAPEVKTAASSPLVTFYPVWGSSGADGEYFLATFHQELIAERADFVLWGRGKK